MNCRQAQDWMDAALDEGTLARSRAADTPAPPSRAQFDAHLAECPSCARLWGLLRTAEAALRVPRPAAAPEGMLADFRRRLAGESPRPQSARRTDWLRRLWPMGSLAAATAAMALVLGHNLYIAPPRQTARGPAPLNRSQPPAASARIGSRKAPPPERPLPGNRAPAPVAHPAKVMPAPADLYGRADGASKESVRDMPASPAAGMHAAGSGRPRAAGAAGSRLQTSAAAAKPAEPERDAEREAAIPPSGGLGGGGLGGGLGAAVPAAVAPAAPPVPTLTGSAQNGAIVSTRGMKTGAVGQQRATVLAAGEQQFAYQAPPELEVSPAVLTALQRRVELPAEELVVEQVVQDLSEAADVPVKADASVRRLRVSVRAQGEPLWRVLQEVAVQGRLQVFPVGDQLVLRPAPAGRGEALLRERMVRGMEHARAPAPRPAPGPREEQARKLVLREPDRRVWPALWGELPERGFAVPPPTELPPLTLQAPAAADEKPAASRQAPAQTRARPKKR